MPAPPIPVSSRPGPFAVGIGCCPLLGLVGVTGSLFFGSLVTFRNGSKQLFLWRYAVELAPQQGLDRRDLERVIFTGQADRRALGAGTAGAADTVHVILRIFREGVIDYVTDAVDMDAAAGDIGRHQNPELALTEVFQSTYALLLGDITGQLRGVDTVTHETFLHTAYFILAICKHHDPVEALRLPAKHGIRFIFPQAPNRPVTINGGFPMPCWYDILGMSPARLINQAQMDESAAMVRQLVAEQLEAGIAAERIILAGFSQGGAVVLHAALEAGLPLGGVMALSTYGPTLESLLSERGATPPLNIFFAHGQYDDVLPQQLGRDAHDRLQAAGHHTRWRLYPMAHEVCPQEVADIRSWLCERLAF